MRKLGHIAASVALFALVLACAAPSGASREGLMEKLPASTTTPRSHATEAPTALAELPRQDYPVQPDGLPEARVIRVVDGDTLDVALGGNRERIRLIGMDTPETVAPNRPVECFGREASSRAHALLDGQTVWLEADPSQDSRDQYGRRLVYLWLPGDRLYNLEMIGLGYAHEYTYATPYKYQALFRAAEQAAAEQELGLWSPRTCGGDTERPAEAPPSTAPALATQGTCDPAYPDVCIPAYPPDLQCADIPYRRFRVLPPDPHGFDGGGDGVGCERD